MISLTYQRSTAGLGYREWFRLSHEHLVSILPNSLAGVRRSNVALDRRGLDRKRPGSNMTGCPGSPAQQISDLKVKLTMVVFVRDGPTETPDSNSVLFMPPRALPAQLDDHEAPIWYPWLISLTRGEQALIEA